MKSLNIALSLIALAGIVGCKSRTVVDRPVINSVQDPYSPSYGAKVEDKVVEKKIVWFWQKDFRTPSK